MFLNFGGVSGIILFIGVLLLFISYGGSLVVMFLCVVGFVMVVVRWNLLVKFREVVYL